MAATIRSSNAGNSRWKPGSDAYDARRTAERKLLPPIIDRIAGFGDFNVGQLNVQQSNQSVARTWSFGGNNLQTENGTLGQAIDYCVSPEGQRFHDGVTDLSKIK